jgi:hypothetical protein
LTALAAVVAVVAVLACGLYAYYRWNYPYGSSHCCDIGLAGSLSAYAREHGGAFPSGERTPEASLSLLYPKYTNANALRGKTVPLETVEEILESGQLLGPDTCGWHYVEGLTLKDDGRIAILWDKAGLGHNGERLREGGHYVVFLRGDREYVPESEWPAFLEKQEELLRQRRPIQREQP